MAYTEKQLMRAYVLGVWWAVSKDDEAFDTMDVPDFKSDWPLENIAWEKAKRWILLANPDDGPLVDELFPNCFVLTLTPADKEFLQGLKIAVE